MLLAIKSSRTIWNARRICGTCLSPQLPLTVLACVARFLSFTIPAASDASEIDFNHGVRQILSENCFKCHGPDEAARKSGLRLDNRADALKPSESGKAAITPAAPDKS